MHQQDFRPTFSHLIYTTIVIDLSRKKVKHLTMATQCPPPDRTGSFCITIILLPQVEQMCTIHQQDSFLFLRASSCLTFFVTMGRERKSLVPRICPAPGSNGVLLHNYSSRLHKSGRCAQYASRSIYPLLEGYLSRTFQPRGMKGKKVADYDMSCPRIERGLSA
jgi:hypothetical protein